MADDIIKLKFRRKTKEMVNSVIKSGETIVRVETKNTISFKEIKQKYLEMIGEENSEHKINLFYRWEVIDEETTPEKMGITSMEGIRVDYNPFMRNNKLELNEIPSVLLAGVYNEGSPLFLLRGCPHILDLIWRFTVSYWKQVIRFPSVTNSFDFDWYHCKRNSDYSLIGSHPDAFFLAPVYSGSGSQDKLTFPKPSNININMMPFILEGSFEECKLPPFVKPYWEFIKTCARPELERRGNNMWRSDVKSDIGKVCYLTIQETEVNKGTSQRRPGLHVDNPGYVKIKNGDIEQYGEGEGHSNPYIGHTWGSGGAHLINTEGDDRFNFIVMTGGIYMASSVANSCIAWDCKIVPDQQGKEVIGRLGDIEHIRPVLSAGHVLEPNQMYWITDRTPHESLPLEQSQTRQFFRMVTSQVSLWYKDHSTANPLGVKPDSSITKVVKGDKFSEEGVEILENGITKMLKLPKKLLSKVQN